MFRLLTPSSEQVSTLEAQFNEPDADIDNGDGRSFVTRQGFLVTSEVPEGFDVAPDEFAVVEARDGFPSTLILGQNQLIAPFIAGLEEIDFQQEIGLANTLFDQARNNGGSNIRDVDPNDIDEVADLFVGSDILAAGADAGKVTAVEPSAEQFDAILESLQEDGGLTPDGFAVGPLPRVLENTDNPDPNQIVLTSGGTTSDGQEVPRALFVENLQQVAVFNAALEEAGLSEAEINNLVNNVFNPLRNNQLEDFNADLAADIGILFDGAEIVDGGAIGGNDVVVDAGEAEIVDDGEEVADGGEEVVDDGDEVVDDGEEIVDVDDEAPVVNNGRGGAEFIAFDANADQLSIIQGALETGDTAGISVDNFAVGEIPAALRDAGNPNAVLITEGGVDADGNDVPSSLLFDPDVLQRQANIRIAAEENFPDDPETRNLLQRQFDQVRNDNLRPLDDINEVEDVTAIFDGLDLRSVGAESAATAEAGGDEDADGQIIGNVNEDDGIFGNAGSADNDVDNVIVASLGDDSGVQIEVDDFAFADEDAVA